MRLLLITGAAFSTVGAALAVEAPAQTSAAKDQLVCTNHIPTGSRFARRTCRTREERSQISEQQRRDAGEMIDGGRPNICSGDRCLQTEQISVPPRQ
jgi:hypothetical protein